MSTGDLDYVGYIRLAALHEAVQPLTPEHDAVTHGAEHLFIVTHQVAELWLKQVLLDVDRAERALAERGLTRADEHLVRASRVFEQVIGATSVLTRLPPSDFARFRSLLGTASGAQSPQFHELGSRLGVRGKHSILYEHFESVLAESSLSVADLYRWGPSAGAVYQLAEHLVELAHGFWRWQSCHVETVRRVIGCSGGTGGTSGVDHLVKRMELPFPELWEVRGAAVRETAVRP
ncbi:tryptophan 2,3-dioxygenase [Crossiella equi]|uniref:Tryptophan 2,3-dioxygenase n=1 Tax=Crossiella equi TaxID=130796 RepID=A0ABS5AT03_9PSEU|nr:tryptophan 2,3-dioxygenase family protein [Crossiella equi]MBP2479707.1 tryptophan 2,3-dioxygenase [Crossiella equi]